MSQRRQDARRAKQEQRWAARHSAPATARHAAAPARPASAETTAPKETFWTARNRWIVFGGIGAVLLVALTSWVVQQVFFLPLPGEQFPSQGNAHLADASSPHDPYNSNPPTSGPHLPPVPRPGIYIT